MQGFPFLAQPAKTLCQTERYRSLIMSFERKYGEPKASAVT